MISKAPVFDGLADGMWHRYKHLPLIAYPLPQTPKVSRLALGTSVDAEIDPTAVHTLVSPPGPEIAAAPDLILLMCSCRAKLRVGRFCRYGR